MTTDKPEDSRMALLYLVAREFNRNIDLEATLRRVLIATVRVVGAHNGSFFVFNSDGSLNKSLFVDGAQVLDIQREIVNRLLQEGLAGWVLQHQKPALISHAEQDERWYADHAEPSLLRHQSAICIPLLHQNKVLAILTITHQTPNYFDNSDLTILTAIADQATSAILNARLHQAEQDRRRTLATLTDISRRLNATLELENLYELLLNELGRLFEHNRSAIFLWHNKQLQYQYGQGQLNPNRSQDSFKLYQDDFAYALIHKKQALRSNNLQTENTWFKDVTDRGQKSWLAATLLQNNHVLGLLTISSHLENVYTDDDLTLFSMVCTHAANALANARLLSRLQAADEKYMGLFEENPDIILLLNENGLILDANRKTCQIFRRPKDAIIGSHLDLLSPNLQGVFEHQLARLRHGVEISTEVSLTDSYNNSIPVEVMLKQIQLKGQTLIQWVGRDVSTRYELAKARRDFTNMLVHDLRGPISTLIGSIQMLDFIIQETPDDPLLNEANDIVQIALRTSRYVTDLIDSMLDISKQEDGQFPINPATTSMRGLLNNVRDQVLPQAAAKNIQLTFPRLEEDSAAYLDPHLIRRVLVNLIDNAIKYIPNGGRVDVEFTLETETLTMRVIDNGHGIPEDSKLKIFQKFARLHHTTNIQGVGLGLAFCKMAVEAHSGRIWLENTAGQGSTFTFVLPQKS
jgi:PAS domain S-box-containing protein